MPVWSEVTTPADLVERIEFVKTCCLQGWTPECEDPVRIVASWARYDVPTDDDRVVIFEAKAGTFGVFDDGEDYTGHG